MPRTQRRRAPPPGGGPPSEGDTGEEAAGCDPLAPSCTTAEACIGDPEGDGFVCVSDASGGMAPAGTPCEFANVCNPGLFCANPDFFPAPDCEDSLGCCAPFCDLDDESACEGLPITGATCVAWYEDGQAPLDLEHVGGCGIGA